MEGWLLFVLLILLVLLFLLREINLSTSALLEVRHFPRKNDGSFCDKDLKSIHNKLSFLLQAPNLTEHILVPGITGSQSHLTEDSFKVYLLAMGITIKITPRRLDIKFNLIFMHGVSSVAESATFDNPGKACNIPRHLGRNLGHIMDTIDDSVRIK
jgi:hypothetical protein